MAETVNLRQKTEQTLSVGKRAERTPSQRSQRLSRFLARGRDRDKLEKKGIYKSEAVFGNDLEKVPLFNELDEPGALENGLPEFLVLCVQKIDTMIAESTGLYRVNGDASKVQKIRLDIDNDNYKSFNNCTDVNVLSSSLKLFFRELKTPIVSMEVRDILCQTLTETEKANIVKIIGKALDKMDKLKVRVLHYFLLHLRRVALEPKTKMNHSTLATVVSPNLVHSVTGARRPSSLISELEMNNAIIEQLLNHLDDVF